MALSKEEISIRVGVDAAAVMKGVSSISGYLSKWRNKQKTDEEAYTDFWKSELAKRDSAEIESAVRRNKARALWRERAAKHEEKIAAESAAKIAAQEAATANTFYNRNIAQLNKKMANFGKGLAAGAAMGGVMMLIGAITDAFDAAIDAISKKYYDLIYGVSENLNEIVDKNHEKWKAIVAAQDKANAGKKEMGKTIRDEKFDTSTNLGKLFMVETELAAQEKIAKLAYETWQIQLKKNKNSQATFEAQSKFYEEEKKRIDYTKSVREQTAALSKDEMIERLQFEWRMAKAEKDRGAMIAIRRTIGEMTGGALNPTASPSGNSVDDYMAKIKAGQDAYKSKTDYSQFGKVIKAAQKEAIAETIQPVSIVDIKTK